MSSYNPYDLPPQQQYQQQQPQYNHHHHNHHNHNQHHNQQHYNNNNHLQQHQPQPQIQPPHQTYQKQQHQQQYPPQYQHQQQQQPHYPPPTLPLPPPTATPPPPSQPTQTPPAYDPYYYQQQYSLRPLLPTHSQPLLNHPTGTTGNVRKQGVQLTRLPTVVPPVSLNIPSSQPNNGRYRPPSPNRRSERYHPRPPSPRRTSLPHRNHQQPQHFHPYKTSSRPPHPTPPSQPPPFQTARPRNASARYQSPRNQPPSRHPSRNLPSASPTTPSMPPPPPANPKQNSALKSGKNPVAEVVREALAMFIHRELIVRTTDDQKAILESPESLTKEFKKFITPAVFEEAKRKLSGKNGGPDISAAVQSSPEYAALLGDAKTVHHTFHSALATARHSTVGPSAALMPNRRAIEKLGESWDSVKLAKMEAKEAKRIAAMKHSESNSGEHTRNGVSVGGVEGTAGGGNFAYGDGSGNFSRRVKSPRRNCNNELAVLRKRNRGLEAAYDAVLRAEAATEAAREQGRVRVERLCAALESRDAARAERDESRARLEAFRKAVDEYLPIEVKSKLAQDERLREEETSSSSSAAVEKEELKIEIQQVRELLTELRSEASSLAKQRDSMSRMAAEIQAEEIRSREKRDALSPENPPSHSPSHHHALPLHTESVEHSVKKEPQVETRTEANENNARLNYVLSEEISMDLVEKNLKSETDDEDNTVSSEEWNRVAEGLASPENDSRYGPLFTLDY